MCCRAIALLIVCACAESHNAVEQNGSTYSAAQGKRSAIVLDAVPLTTIFQRFFKVDREVFTPQQSKHLGTISYVSADPTLLNGRSKYQLDQAYVRTLRTVLLSRCQQLATKEAQALHAAQEGDVFAKHRLIKRYGAPTTAEVSAIMSSMFGAQRDEHRGASDYAALMAENWQMFRQDNPTPAAQQEELSKQYVLLCMAIGQDTRVYLR